MNSFSNQKTNLNEDKATRHQVNVEKKYQFLELILCQGNTIKESAIKTNINFATAKKILSKFRKEGNLNTFSNELNKQVQLLGHISKIQQQMKDEKNKKVQEKKAILIQRLQKFTDFDKSDSQESIPSYIRLQNLELTLAKERQFQMSLLINVLEAQIDEMRKEL